MIKMANYAVYHLKYFLLFSGVIFSHHVAWSTPDGFEPELLCHADEGNDTHKTFLVKSQGAKNAHLAHGSDTLGACEEQVPAHCSNEYLDSYFGETDVDCGGPCPACESHKLCNIDLDCESKKCEEVESENGCENECPIVKRCAPPTCNDEILNGFETDVDCGGPDCSEKCEPSEGCFEDSDCKSKICDENKKCTTPSCDDGVQNGLETHPDCNDGNICTVDSCSNETGCSFSPLNCDDENGCTDDSCDPNMEGGCISDYNTNPCDDDDECTVGDTCSEGSCEGSVKECFDGNECTDDLCDSDVEGGCVFPFNTEGCDDGNACTVADSCVEGGCEGTSPRDCSDGDECTIDSCDPETGCQYERVACCTNGISDGEETGVDCGGPCDKCGALQRCEFDDDCEENRKCIYSPVTKQGRCSAECEPEDEDEEEISGSQAQGSSCSSVAGANQADLFLLTALLMGFLAMRRSRKNQQLQGSK